MKILTIMCSIFLMMSCAGDDKMKKAEYTNKLINEKSPYLLQHAHNSVDWYSWGKEAFDKAKKENKPIFLSIGYSTCHWCHVMEKESFENAKVAKLMNDVFICIKVDREERPDIDSIYMNVCQMMTRSGGWPLTIIMTPDKKPFFATTYIPRESKFGQIGLMELIPKINNAWKNQRKKLSESAEHITNAVNSLNTLLSQKIDSELLKNAVSKMYEHFDSLNGGFGTAPKFPSPHKLIFLLQNFYYTKNKKDLSMVETTLTKMRLGGIFDHIGYGFHRYSTDKKWLLPHFEKMLYDQAMLSSAYLEAYQLTKKMIFANVAEEIFTYIIRDMTAPEGAFYSAEDGEEGKYYVWSYSELRKFLTADELKFMQDVFHVSETGNFKDEASGQKTGENILYLDTSLTLAQSKKLDIIRKKLMPIRIKRVHPLKDTKILTDWNGLMIASFAKAARILHSEKYKKVAISAMDFILKNMFDKDNRLMHRYRDGEVAIFAKIDDYAFTVNALIELYETTFDPAYLAKAVELTDAALKHFKDTVGGGMFLTADYDEKLIARPKDAYDGAVPSGNSVFALNLLKLSKLTGKTAYEKEAENIINTFAVMINKSPESFSQMLIAYQFAKYKSREIMITGNPKTQDYSKIIRYINSVFMPDSVTMLKTDSNAEALAKVAKFTEVYPVKQNKVKIFICIGQSCEAPISDLKTIMEKIQ